MLKMEIVMHQELSILMEYVHVQIIKTMFLKEMNVYAQNMPHFGMASIVQDALLEWTLI